MKYYNEPTLNIHFSPIMNKWNQGSEEIGVSDIVRNRVVEFDSCGSECGVTYVLDVCPLQFFVSITKIRHQENIIDLFIICGMIIKLFNIRIINPMVVKWWQEYWRNFHGTS